MGSGSSSGLKECKVELNHVEALRTYNTLVAKGESAQLASQFKPERSNTLKVSPADAKFKLCVVQFKVPDAKNGGSDKGPDGNRIDSIPIANGVIDAGGACACGFRRLEREAE